MVMGNEIKRSFSLSDGSKYNIKDPSTEDIKNADWVYSKVYTKSLIEGITTSSEMVDILTKRGIIGPEYEKRARELSETLRNLIDDLNESKDTDDKYSKAMKVAEARDDLYRWNQRFSSPMSHTCEQLADDSRLEYLTFSMVYDENSNRVWNNNDEYVHEDNKELTRRSRIEVMLYLQGVSSDFMNETPEAVAMRQVEQELADQYEKENKLEDELTKEKEFFEEGASDSEPPTEVEKEEVEVDKEEEEPKKEESKPKAKAKRKPVKGTKKDKK